MSEMGFSAVAGCGGAASPPQQTLMIVDARKALKKLNDKLNRISECKTKLKQGKVLEPQQKEMLLQEHQFQQEFDDLKKMYPRVAKKMFETKSSSARLDPPKTHEYFYVLPQTNDAKWHDVHQQRLDSDAGAASKVKSAILAKCSGLKDAAVEVVAVHVDLFNSAYTLYNEKIYRPKVYVGHSATSPLVHQWRPQNKRFLVRVPVAHSHHVMHELTDCPVPIVVKNVNPLPTRIVVCQPWMKNQKYNNSHCPLGIDFENYEMKSRKEVDARDANRQDITLSLCLPFVFAVQASLACPDQPSSPVDFCALGTAFLDIIKPGTWQEHMTLTNSSFFNSVTFLMRNCFAHFREVNNGHQSFGINTKERALSHASHEWCYTGTGMQGKMKKFEMPARPPPRSASEFKKGLSFQFPSDAEVWDKSIPKRDAAVLAGDPASTARAEPSRAQSSFDILESLRLKMRPKAAGQPVSLATQAHPFQESDLMKFNFRLDCMPTVPFDMEKKSMLDWYFDCDDEQHSLRELLKQSAALLPASAPLAAASKSGPGPKATPRKLERYSKAEKPDDGEGSCYILFQGLLAAFRSKIQKLAERYCKGDPTNLEACDERVIWVRSDEYALDTCPSGHPNPQEFKHSVWLGLGRLEDGFRKPVAFKRNDETPQQQEKLVRIMRKLKPGSFIASAELVEVEPLNPTAETPRALQKRWMSEAGVCTLEELFGRILTPKDIIERKTKAHRMLVREILHSMALAVFHLHECKIAHTNINLKYFKVFLIQEPPRSTNLRVKLVSMRRADTLTPVRECEDIEDLGKAMARVVLGESSNMEELLSYDPSLYWLVSWILEESDSATLADIIRHPYFMSLNEKEVFTLALEGDIFGETLTTAELSASLDPLRTKTLTPFLDRLFHQAELRAPA